MYNVYIISVYLHYGYVQILIRWSNMVPKTTQDSDFELAMDQWEFQDPKMEVLYHIRPYFVGIFPYIGLKNRPYIW